MRKYNAPNFNRLFSMLPSKSSVFHAIFGLLTIRHDNETAIKVPKHKKITHL